MYVLGNGNQSNYWRKVKENLSSLFGNSSSRMYNRKINQKSIQNAILHFNAAILEIDLITLVIQDLTDYFALHL